MNRVAQSLVLCVVFVDRYLSLSLSLSFFFCHLKMTFYVQLKTETNP